MYAIVVDFTIHPLHIADFRKAMIENADASLAREPACRQFDVCLDPEADNKVFLYELYDNKAAFDAHLASEHFQTFNAKTASWVADKTVSAYERAYPNT